MKRILSVLLCLCMISCKSGSTVKQPPAGPGAALSTEAQPFPQGFDYPLSADILNQAVKTRDTARLRIHGWYLFAGLHTPAPNGLPIWRNWPTSTSAYAPSLLMDTDAKMKPASGRSLIRVNLDNTPVYLPDMPLYPVNEAVCDTHHLSGCPGKSPPFYTLRDGAAFQNNGDIMIAGVIYNEPAFDWIRGKGNRSPRLFEASTLSANIPAQGKIAQIPAFPSGSFVLKHMYWPVPGDACGALPVWDAPTPPNPSTYMGYEKWSRAVAVASPGCKAVPGTKTRVSFLHGVSDSKNNPLPAVTFDDAKVVSLSDFYHQTFDARTLRTLSDDDRAILDASAYWAYGRSFQAGDSIVSIAMHIFTKEMPTWTMQSFWWHDAADQGPYASDRPEIPLTQAADTWRHYLMTSEYGIPTANDPKQLPASFNPYIELVSHPVATNCRNCHLRAAWPRESTRRQPFAAYQIKPVENDPGLVANIQPNDAILQGLLQLDFQWAISDRAIPSDPPQPANP